MRPEQALTIYEIRAREDGAFQPFEGASWRDRLGPTLAGLHLEADFAFIFLAGEACEAVDDFLHDHPGLELKHIHHLTYAQWQDGAGAEPLWAGGLLIVPPGRLMDEAEDVRRLIIDPGLAFGFGGHPTTSRCLDFLARVMRSGPPRTALDLGCGAGILSLAAALMGVEKTLGVDHSHLAVEASLNNMRLNKLEDRVEFVRGDARDFAGRPGELLMANLHLSLQNELLKLGAFERRRHVIISGLLPAEGDGMRAGLEKIGLKLVDQARTDRWSTMLFKLGESIHLKIDKNSS
ncbi:MAG: 50S ribosomal protein L11 methyltransferase [Candidatus Adiutrix sp.]|jgi:ribosomal protein L11 methylase PrmA|nr:50S ribosomal protein L11 methyltransferase [Candidatus Adiutrix sp.]